MKSVIIAAPISESFSLFLTSRFECHTINDKSGLLHISSDEVIGIVTSNKLKLDASLLENFQSLSWIARLGSGLEIIDLNYCEQHQIHCFSSPQGIANSVAEHATGMLLSLRHHIHSSFYEVKNRAWIRDANRGYELENLTLGIIGYGHTGSAFARKMIPFVSKVLAHDKYKKNFENDDVREVSLHKIQQDADIISLHLPLTDETISFYNEKFIDETSKRHILINTSRGNIATTSSILYGFKNDKILGACLDVLSEESNVEFEMKKNDGNFQELLAYPVIITPHIAGYSYDAIEKMSHELLLQIQKIL